ncbi:sugar-transfer associated ATP-grasp domain-containing protein [Sporosarcina thermotolerans]|uniref:sugar-transfer associated ATP-grasp domain-containing protein n=1 Tax=Sporosarcina thermotolerans TaxID=633404 RepID=UPI0024BC20E7|nr:sugar-transfer associated ATP-grasp domain-containing protein [Sporosarcina thermotolerans]WHT48274.1 sugar-transfer associated ATP-grasp domain-containing protein [Sporosarcina thermotolerans]
MKIDVFKTWILEWINIYKKRKLYSQVQLTHEQKNAIDKVWKRIYGKKVSKKWHRLYQSYAGVYNKYYFPEIIYSTKLEPLFSPPHLAKVLEDKALTEILFFESSIKVPKTFVVNSSGVFYDSKRIVKNRKDIIESLRNIGKVVIKATIGSNSGRGVAMLDIVNGVDLISGKTLEQIMDKFKTNYIIQERMKAHPKYASLYDKSINTIRVITYILDGVIYNAPLSMRIGRSGNEVDNIHAGGIVIGFNDKGILNKEAYSEMQERFRQHPDSGIKFEGYVIPYVKDIIKVAKESHSRIPHIKMISWDFMVNESSEIILIEVNLRSQSIWFPQMVNGESFFGKNTEKIIEIISKK